MPNIIKLHNPFRKYQREIIGVAPGLTVKQILNQNKDKRFSNDVLTYINNELIEENARDKRILREWEYLLIVPKVAGGGDDDGKTILNIVLMIAIWYVAPGVGRFIGGAGFLAAAAQVAWVVGGGILISSLQPSPKKPTSGYNVDEEQSQSFGWNPATVQRQGIAIPRVYGLNKLYGNVIAAYTEEESLSYSMTTITEIFYYIGKGVLGHRQQLRGTRTRDVVVEFDPRKVNLCALFCLGAGPIREMVVSGSLKLNDQFIENLTNVEYEERCGDLRQQRVSFFDTTKLEVVVNRLVKNGSPVTYTTLNANFDELEVELSFPAGLFDGSGADLANNTVNVTVEIKKATSDTWSFLANGVNITDNVGDKVIETYSTVGVFTVDYGCNYDIRVTKNTAERDNVRFGDDLYLDKVREVIDHPFTYPRRSLVGIKAQATEQLSGSIRFSCLSRGLYVRVYDGAVWNIQYSNNPAWVIYDILTQPVYTGAHSPWLDLKLLLNFEGTDGAVSTTDDSPRGHEITFVGTAQIDTAEDKFGNSSLLVDGNSDSITMADSDDWDIFKNLVENWLIDLFVKHTDHAGTEYYIVHYEDANNYWAFYHEHGGTGVTFILVEGGVTTFKLEGTEIADVNWHHIALCKVEDGIGLYVDGTQVDYVVLAAGEEVTFDGLLVIGEKGDASDWFDGNLDHIRIIKSNIFSAAPNVGLTDTIVVPTAAYTDPGNSYVVNRYDGYNPSKLLTADFEELADWCDDTQINPVNFGVDSISQAIYAIIETRTNHNFKIGDTVLFRGISTCGMTELVDGTTAEIIKVTDNTTFTIDLDTSAYAAYTGTEPLLLMHFDGTEGSTTFTDETGSHVITAVGNAKISTSNKIFGTGSGLFDGVGDSLTIPDHADFDLVGNAADSRTISFFIRHISMPSFFSPWQDYMAQWEDDNNYWSIHCLSGGYLRFWAKSGGVKIIDVVSDGGVITNNTWYHIALCKVADKYGLYVDGTQVAYTQDASTDTFAAILRIGSRRVANWEFNGRMDELIYMDINQYNAAPNVGLTDTIDVPQAPLTLGYGTVEKHQLRFAFNGIFDTETNMWEAALGVCELCRCVPFWDGDVIRLAIDKAGSSVYAFTMGNIIKDSFTQKFIPTAERASEIEVHYRDASKDYERMPFTLINSDIGNTTSKVRLDLFGITDTDIANRLVDFKLLQNLYLKKIAIWQADIESIACTIGDIVDVQHDVTNWGSIGSDDDDYTGGGRIIAATRVVHEELIANGNFTNWTGGDPDDWTVVGEVGTDPECSEVGAGEGHGGRGGGMCNIYTSAVAISVRQTITTVSNTAHVITLTIDKVTAGGVRILISQVPYSLTLETFTTAGVKTMTFIARETSPSISIWRVGATDVTISNISVKSAVATSANSNEVITIGGKIKLDDADFRGGSTTYALLVKPHDDSAPESRAIIGLNESTVEGGFYDITVSGVYSVYSQKNDVWAAGIQDYETLKYRIINIRRSENNRAEIKAIEYQSAIYAND